jgi:hypothetical protein
MNRKSLIATIKSRRSDQMMTGRYANGDLCKYICIFDDPGRNGSVGISERGFWCSINDGVIREVTGPDHQRILFRILENPLGQIIKLIKQGLQSNNLPDIAIITFPFDDILIASFESSWAELGLKWIDQGYPMNDEMRLVLCDNDKQSKIWLKAQRERLGEILGI